MHQYWSGARWVQAETSQIGLMPSRFCSFKHLLLTILKVQHVKKGDIIGPSMYLSLYIYIKQMIILISAWALWCFTFLKYLFKIINGKEFILALMWFSCFFYFETWYKSMLSVPFLYYLSLIHRCVYMHKDNDKVQSWKVLPVLFELWWLFTEQTIFKMFDYNHHIWIITFRFIFTKTTC